MRGTRRNAALAAVAIAGIVAGCGGSATGAPAEAASSSPSVKVVGNQLVNGRGKAIRLIGVNRSGTEYSCTGPLAGQSGGPYGYGIFQGPTNARSIKALLSWRVNAVALPLNEACWLGGYGNLSSAYSGAAYRKAITAYVKALHRQGIFVVIRLSGAAPGNKPFGTIAGQSSNEVPMADADHSLDFWTSVARTFKGDRMVVFHAFDEPHDLSWDCLLKGCTVTDAPDGKDRYGSYRSVGHQAIVDAIRATGAKQPIVLAGPGFAGDLSEWLAHMPNDPANQLMADVSSFDYGDYVVRERATIAKVAAKVPVIIGGFGDTDCNSDYSRKVMKIADQLGLSELAWTWNTVQDYGGCQNALLDAGSGKSADSGYASGRPSGYGKGVRSHFRKIDAHRRYRATRAPATTGDDMASSRSQRARRAVAAGAAAVLTAGAASATADGASFRENFSKSGGAKAFGSATWWDQDAWDVRSDTYDVAITPVDESAKWRGHYTAIEKSGAGTMHLDFQGIVSARLRNPMVIGSKGGTVSFRAPLFATTGHWWEVAVTPTDQPTAGEYTAVPARQSPEGLNSPVSGKDDDGSTNGPGHRAAIEDSVNVISTGFPDAPTCNDVGWRARWAVTESRGGKVKDHVNRKPFGSLYRVDPRKRTRLIPWKIVFTKSKIALYGDRNGDGKLEKVDAWKVSIPWSQVYVNLLYVAYQAGHHPQVGCGYGKNGVEQAQSTTWKDVKVSPVAYSRTVALPKAGQEDGWSSYDLRDFDAHVGSGQPNRQRYDKYQTYLACSKDNGGGLPCPDRARTTIKLQTMVDKSDLSGLRRAQILADLRYAGKASVAVNGKDIGSFPRVTKRPDIAENNGFGDAFEETAWVRRGLDIPASALGEGLNTITISLDPSENVDIDRIQLELAQG